MNSRAQRIETFALSRCPGIEPTRQHLERQQDFSAEAFSQDAFGITLPEKSWKVRLLFSREVATYIKERTWHHSQRFLQRRDGSLEMRVESSGRKELTRWVLSWIPEVKVIAPRELQERVRKRLCRSRCFSSGLNALKHQRQLVATLFLRSVAASEQSFFTVF